MFNEHVGPIFEVHLVSDSKQAATEAPPSSPADVHKRVNMEFIREVHQVTLNRSPSDDEYNKWMNVIDQGGSYEGIYNGLVNGAEYAQTEKGIAPPSGIRLYAELMARIALDIKYDPIKIKAAKDEDTTLGIARSTPLPTEPTEEEKKALIADFAVKAVNKSQATLRKETGAEALKLMEMKREYKEKFATWYGKFVVYSNSKNINFGIEERNKGDEQFHYKWALQNEEDRVKWEIINRIHRLYNALTPQ